MGAKFYLYNGADTFPLNGEQGTWLTAVTGLGSAVTSEFVHVNGSYLRTKKQEAQAVLNGEIHFLLNSYEQFQALNAFINADALELRQEVQGIMFRRSVVVRSFTRTDRDKKGHRADISFYALTPWFRTESMSGTTFTVNGVGHLPTCLKITGTLSASDSIVIDAGELGRCEVKTTIKAGDSLDYSSLASDSHVIINGNDAAKYLDIASFPFIRIPCGTTATITCSQAVSLEAFHYWRAV